MPPKTLKEYQQETEKDKVERQQKTKVKEKPTWQEVAEEQERRYQQEKKQKSS